MFKVNEIIYILGDDSGIDSTINEAVTALLYQPRMMINDDECQWND
jgi:hypothetical protein